MAGVSEVEKEVKLSPASSSESLEVEIVNEKPGTTAEVLWRDIHTEISQLASGQNQEDGEIMEDTKSDLSLPKKEDTKTTSSSSTMTEEEEMKWAVGAIKRLSSAEDTEEENEKVKEMMKWATRTLERTKYLSDSEDEEENKKKKKTKKEPSTAGCCENEVAQNNKKLLNQPAYFGKTYEGRIKRKPSPRSVLSCPAKPDTLRQEGELDVEPSEEPHLISPEFEIIEPVTDDGCHTLYVLLVEPDTPILPQAGTSVIEAGEQKCLVASSIENLMKVINGVKTGKNDMEVVEIEEQTFVSGITVEDYIKTDVKTENDNVEEAEVEELKSEVSSEVNVKDIKIENDYVEEAEVEELKSEVSSVVNVKDIKIENENVEETEVPEQMLVISSVVENYTKKDMNAGNKNRETDVLECDVVSMRSDVSGAFNPPNALDTSESLHSSKELRTELLSGVSKISKRNMNSLTAPKIVNALNVSEVPSARAALHGSELSNVSRAVCGSKISVASSLLRGSGSSYASSTLCSSKSSSETVTLRGLKTSTASSTLHGSNSSNTSSLLCGSYSSNASRKLHASKLLSESSTSDAAGSTSVSRACHPRIPQPLCKEGLCGTCYQHLRTIMLLLSDVYPIKSKTKPSKKLKKDTERSGSSERRMESRDEDLCSVCDKPPFGLGFCVLSHIVTCWAHQCLQCKWRFADKKLFLLHQKICVNPPPNRCCVLCVMGPGCDDYLGFLFNIFVKCPACGLSFVVIGKLRVQPQLCYHYGTHLWVQRLACCTCGECFYDKAPFNEHQRTEHEVTRKRLPRHLQNDCGCQLVPQSQQ